MSFFDDNEDSIIYGPRGTRHRDMVDGREPRFDVPERRAPPPLRPPNGFREFSQQKAPVNPYDLELCDLARLYIEETWEEEFLASVRGVVLDSRPLSEKQLNLLQAIASGAMAERRAAERERQEDGVDRGETPPRDDDIPF